MNDLYTVKFLYDTLFLLSTQLEDLEKWSVYNNDTCNEEISALRSQFEAVKKKLFEIAGTDIDRTNISERGGDE